MIFTLISHILLWNIMNILILMEKDLDERESKVMDLATMISRAEISEIAKKHSLAVNHYFNIISQYYSKLSGDQIKNITESFVINVFFLPSNYHKERMLNYILRNENLEISKYRRLFDEIYNKRLIHPNYVIEIFSSSRDKIHNIINSETNYLERSSFEHNLISIANVFQNISVQSLCHFLSYSEEKILSMTFKLIRDGRINAKIDEYENYIYFEQSDETFQFDLQIHNFCVNALQLNEYIYAHN